MIQELIYTSAPRGLKAGSMGFCTVATTQGLPSNLAERLEALSAYRQVYSPQDPLAHLNPVAFSHLKIVVAGKSYQVLSRVAAAGLDYSQRSNKIASHLALEGGALDACGPAALLAAPGVMQTRWEGDPRILPGKHLPSAGRAAGVCRQWQQLTGDAGWGGAVAEAAANPKQQVTIIFKPGQDMLALLDESLAWLTPAQRWGVSFCTFFTKLPTGVECRVRCVLDGSPEAAAARPSPSHLVLNLAKPMEAAQGGPLVAAARSGTGAVGAALPSQPEPRVAAAAGRTPVSDAGYDVSRGAPEQFDYGLEPLGSKKAKTTPVETRAAPSMLKSPGRRPEIVMFSALGVVILLLAVGVLSLLVVPGLAAGLFGSGTAKNQPRDPKPGPDEQPDPGFKPSPPTVKEKTEAQKRAERAAQIEQERQDRLAAEQKKKHEEELIAAAKIEAELKENERQEAERKRLENERLQQIQSLITKLPTSIELPPIGDKEPRPLASRAEPANWAEAPDCNLELFYNKQAFRSPVSPDDRLVCRADPSSSGAKSKKAWVIERVGKSATGDISDDLAKVSLGENGWSFQWTGRDLGDGGQTREQLRNCVLKIAGYGQTRHVRLRTPQIVKKELLAQLVDKQIVKPVGTFVPDAKYLREKTPLIVEALPPEGIKESKAGLNKDPRILDFSYSLDGVRKKFGDGGVGQEFIRQLSLMCKAVPEEQGGFVTGLRIRFDPYLDLGDWADFVPTPELQNPFAGSDHQILKHLTLDKIDTLIIEEIRNRIDGAIKQIKDNDEDIGKHNRVLTSDKSTAEEKDKAARKMGDLRKRSELEKRKIEHLKVQEAHAQALKGMLESEFGQDSKIKLNYRVFIKVGPAELDLYQSQPREQLEPPTSQPGEKPKT